MKYICTTCGAEFLKWSGRCPSCGEWGTLEESEEVNSEKEIKTKSSPAKYQQLLDDKHHFSSNIKRISTKISEFDRVLGGGFIPGEVILVSGEPGVGKSTLLLQVALNIAVKEKVLYIAGEESPGQLYSRVDRLLDKKVENKDIKRNLLVTDEIDVDKLEALISVENFGLVIADSIQSLVSEKARGYSGSIGQVRVSGAVLTRVAKETTTPVLMVGQINKVGNIAGPKVLEHIVDCVLYFEGGEYNQYRILRGMKNRFGSTNEIGVFEMTSFGLKEIKNPSLVFLDEANKSSGSAIGAVLQGSRVVFVEVQALVAEREYEGGPLRRVANGIKKPRLDMLCAVLSRKGNVFLGDKDVFVNVVGGMSVNNPSIDLAVCAAIKSAVKDNILDRESIYFGEVGLTGEVRGSWGIDSVLSEADRVGYKSAVVGRAKAAKIGNLVVKKVSRLSSL
jgi:DNA repair protein RadA/Sms